MADIDCPPNNASESKSVVAAPTDKAASSSTTSGVVDVVPSPIDPDDPRCYCGLGRNMISVEFQCGMCLRFYHSDCMSSSTKPCVPFTTNYQFFCQRCGSNGRESFNKKPANFSQMCYMALANLSYPKSGTQYFSKDREIIPYIEANWESLTVAPRRIKTTWHNTIGKAMLKDSDIFACREQDLGETLFGLYNTEFEKIGPNCEMIYKLSAASARSAENRAAAVVEVVSKGRGQKRKGPNESSQVLSVRQKRGEQASASRMSAHGYPYEHPMNKDGYRYMLAESDPHAPNRQAFDASVEWAGKPIPGYLYRTALSCSVLLALHDRALQLKVSEDRLTVTGEKGYSLVRATHGVHQGSWYFEVNITKMTSDAATRIGWSQELGNLQAPCGYDKFGYSWRSRKGTVFHESRGHSFSSGYGEGDVIGLMIELSGREEPSQLLPASHKDQPLVKFKNHLYYEAKDNAQETEKQLKPMQGSKISLYKNGASCGVAFRNIYKGTYYPSVSLYKNACVSLNFGPDFKYPPKDVDHFKPMSDCADAAIVENCLADVLFHIEHEGQLPEFT